MTPHAKYLHIFAIHIVGMAEAWLTESTITYFALKTRRLTINVNYRDLRDLN